MEDPFLQKLAALAHDLHAAYMRDKGSLFPALMPLPATSDAYDDQFGAMCEAIICALGCCKHGGCESKTSAPTGDWEFPFEVDAEGRSAMERVLKLKMVAVNRPDPSGGGRGAPNIVYPEDAEAPTNASACAPKGLRLSVIEARGVAGEHEQVNYTCYTEGGGGGWRGDPQLRRTLEEKRTEKRRNLLEQRKFGSEGREGDIAPALLGLEEVSGSAGPLRYRKSQRERVLPQVFVEAAHCATECLARCSADVDGGRIKMLIRVQCWALEGVRSLCRVGGITPRTFARAELHSSWGALEACMEALRSLGPTGPVGKYCHSDRVLAEQAARVVITACGALGALCLGSSVRCSMALGGGAVPILRALYEHHGSRALKVELKNELTRALAIALLDLAAPSSSALAWGEEESLALGALLPSLTPHSPPAKWDEVVKRLASHKVKYPHMSASEHAAHTLPCLLRGSRCSELIGTLLEDPGIKGDGHGRFGGRPLLDALKARLGKLDGGLPQQPAGHAAKEVKPPPGSPPPPPSPLVGGGARGGGLVSPASPPSSAASAAYGAAAAVAEAPAERESAPAVLAADAQRQGEDRRQREEVQRKEEEDAKKRAREEDAKKRVREFPRLLQLSAFPKEGKLVGQHRYNSVLDVILASLELADECASTRENRWKESGPKLVTAACRAIKRAAAVGGNELRALHSTGSAPPPGQRSWLRWSSACCSRQPARLPPESPDIWWVTLNQPAPYAHQQNMPGGNWLKLTSALMGIPLHTIKAIDRAERSAAEEREKHGEGRWCCRKPFSRSLHLEAHYAMFDEVIEALVLLLGHAMPPEGTTWPLVWVQDDKHSHSLHPRIPRLLAKMAAVHSIHRDTPSLLSSLLCPRGCHRYSACCARDSRLLDHLWALKYRYVEAHDRGNEPGRATSASGREELDEALRCDLSHVLVLYLRDRGLLLNLKDGEEEVEFHARVKCSDHDEIVEALSSLQAAPPVAAQCSCVGRWQRWAKQLLQTLQRLACGEGRRIPPRALVPALEAPAAAAASAADATTVPKGEAHGLMGLATQSIGAAAVRQRAPMSACAYYGCCLCCCFERSWGLGGPLCSRAAITLYLLCIFGLAYMHSRGA